MPVAACLTFFEVAEDPNRTSNRVPCEQDRIKPGVAVRTRCIPAGCSWLSSCAEVKANATVSSCAEVKVKATVSSCAGVKVTSGDGEQLRGGEDEGDGEQL